MIERHRHGKKSLGKGARQKGGKVLVGDVNAGTRARGEKTDVGTKPKMQTGGIKRGKKTRLKKKKWGHPRQKKKNCRLHLKKLLGKS